MDVKIVIRSEIDGDVRAIAEVTAAAFKTLEISNHTEQYIIAALVGHPDYYRRFGFSNMPGLACEGVPEEVFFALPFDGHVPQGTVTFHDAFRADG